MKRLVVLAVLIGFVTLLPQTQLAIAKDTWTSVQSKNFFLVGNASDKEIRKVAVRLEQFRDVFTKLFPRIKFTTPVPTTVIVFKSDSSFKPFKPSDVAGYFQPGPDVNYIALSIETPDGQDAFDTIFHEYVHLLVENTMGNAPLWFNEGLAEYYSTFKISDDQKVVLGSPISNHVFLLRQSKMLPLRSLFQVGHKSPEYNERDKKSIFYAQAWAMVHYLVIGKTGRAEQMSAFLEKLLTEMPMEQAFQETFKVNFEVMEKDLREYVRKNSYNVLNLHFERKLETDTDMKSVEMPEAEAQAYLGDLLLHSNRKDAMTYLEKALALDPKSALANTAMGMAQFREGNNDKALVHLERAIAANSTNYLVHYYYAYALSRPAGEGQTISGYPPELAAKIRQELLKAIELRPDFPESYSSLAFLSLITGNNLDESIKLVTDVLKTSPGNNNLLFMLGQLYARTGDYKKGLQLLEQVAKSNADEDIRSRAQQVLSELVAYQKQLAEYESERSAANSPRITGPTGTTGTSVITTIIGSESSTPVDPSSYLRDVLRKPASGETQLQGTLLRVECDAKGIIFVLKAGDKTLRLHTKDLESLELTTYNPELKGDIGCGVRKPEDVVIVCFEAKSDAKLKSDGVLKSVEFVPANFKLVPANFKLVP